MLVAVSAMDVLGKVKPIRRAFQTSRKQSVGPVSNILCLLGMSRFELSEEGDGRLP
jgi:hypothetical protein